MSLRTRIASGFIVVLVLVAGLGIGVIVVQRIRLIEQLDRQLEAIAPLDRPAPPDQRLEGARPDPGRPAEEPISDVFIGTVGADGTLDVLVQGQLLAAVPDVSSFVGADLAGRSYQTVDSTDGSTRFRVLADQAIDDDALVLFALPTTEIDDTIRDLALSFVVVAVLIAAILGVVVWWIVRLGLRPISSMTETARTIAAGQRGERAPALDERTEAGQLAAAFNVMLDQRDQAEDTLRRFASDASHELRTPLTSIRGYLDLYAAGGFREPGELDDVVRRMQHEARRMGELVEQLLQLARLDETDELQVTSTDLGQLVRDVVDNARVRYPDREITLHAPEVGDSTALLDHDRVTQLVTVLVDNAATHAPGATIDVDAHPTPDGVAIVVADDGPGLEPEDADRVFTRFYRTTTSRTRSAGGSGLGLAIAHSIAEAHGGTITLQTAPGAGCRFAVRLPSVRDRGS